MHSGHRSRSGLRLPAACNSCPSGEEAPCSRASWKGDLAGVAKCTSRWPRLTLQEAGLQVRQVQGHGRSVLDSCPTRPTTEPSGEAWADPNLQEQQWGHSRGFALGTTARLSGTCVVGHLPWCPVPGPYWITSVCPRGTLHFSRYLWLAGGRLLWEVLEDKKAGLRSAVPGVILRPFTPRLREAENPSTRFPGSLRGRAGGLEMRRSRTRERDPWENNPPDPAPTGSQ